MKLKRTFILLAASLLLFTGCDAVRSFFGMPTSEDIEAARIAELAEQAKARRMADSLAAIERDSLAALAEKQKVETGARYMVVVGSFKDAGNAPKMITKLKGLGYDAEMLKFGNGFDVVSAFSSDVFSEARKAMFEIMETEFCPEDIWIYDRNEGKHVTNN